MWVLLWPAVLILLLFVYVFYIGPDYLARITADKIKDRREKKKKESEPKKLVEAAPSVLVPSSYREKGVCPYCDSLVK